MLAENRQRAEHLTDHFGRREGICDDLMPTGTAKTYVVIKQSADIFV
jgi:hypothetical protein